MTTVDILIRATELLYEGDWSPTADRGPDGPRCPFWAIADAAGQDKRGEHEAAHTFATAVGTDIMGIGRWNAVPGRTFGEVMDGFSEAIVLAKACERE